MPWTDANESFRIEDIGVLEEVLSLLDDLRCHAVVQHIRCQKRDFYHVFGVIPGRKGSGKRHVRFRWNKIGLGTRALREGFKLVL
jgi:hypothetical protein